MAARALMATLAAAALLGQAQRAAAQSCAPDGPSAVRCRFMLSQPRAYTAVAHAVLPRGETPSPATLSLTVDGRDCLRHDATSGWGRGLGARCALHLSPSDHWIEARVRTSGAAAAVITVRLLPGDRLAALPREADALYPPRPRPWFWPFGR